MPPDHTALAELTGTYVLGALTGSEREAFEAHLLVCAVCAAETRSLMGPASALAALAPAATPSPGVKTRLLAQLEQSRRATLPIAWLAAAAAVVLAVGLGAYASQLRGRVASLESALGAAAARAASLDLQLTALRREAGETRRTLAVLVASDLARIDLAGQPIAPSASARAFWSRSRGLVFAASNLPPLPAGRVYQLWVVTAQPAPMSAGLLTPDASGRASATIETPVDMPQPVAMAVTIEPEGGVASPTGEKYLVGLAH